MIKCENCEENDLIKPIGIIITNDKNLNANNKGIKNNNEIIITIRKHDIGNQIRLKWHSNALGGYYEIISKEWVNVHEDSILTGSEDAEDLKKFDNELTQALKELNIKYVKVISKTSNPLSYGYDFLVKKSDTKKTKKIIRELKELYRNPIKFTATVLTGKTKTKAFTKEDIIFSAIASKILKE